MAYEIVRSPEIIAAEINTIKSQTASMLASAYKQAQNSIFEIGRRLCEVKEMVGHGNWGTWLAENVDYSESTANNLMRIFREMGSGQVDLITGKSDAEIFDRLSQSQLVELFPLPREDRAAFVEAHREEIEGASVRELREMIKAYDELKMQNAELQSQNAGLLEEKGRLEETSASLEEQLSAAREDAAQMRLDLGEKMSAVPSEEEMAAMVEDIRAQLQTSMAAEWQAKEQEIRAEAKKESDDEIDALKRQHSEDVKKAKEEGAASAAKEKAAALEAVEKSRREIAALKAASDTHTQRVMVYLAALQRAFEDLSSELGAMEADQPGDGARLKARCESMMLRMINKNGFQV